MRSIWGLCALAFFLPTALLAACGSGGTPPSTGRVASSERPAVLAPGGAVELAPGGRITVAQTDAVLRFVRVVEDSRCPAGVDCFWAGRAVVELDLSQVERARHALAGTDLVVTVTALEPYPQADRAIRPEERRLCLELSRAR
jgi:hypothetical protein